MAMLHCESSVIDAWAGRSPAQSSRRIAAVCCERITTMDISISYQGKPELMDSDAIEALATILEDQGIGGTLARVTGPRGTKDALAVGISIVALGVTSLNLLLTALNTWRAVYAKYSVSLKSGDMTIAVGGLTEDNVSAAIGSLRSLAPDSTIAISVTRDGAYAQ